MPQCWYEEVCAYLGEEPELIRGAIEGERPRLVEFLNKYQGGKRYDEMLTREVQELGPQAWYDAWAQQWFNIPKMEFLKFQQNGVAELYVSVYESLVDEGVEAPRVLDYGCGTGYFDRFLLEKYPEADVTLVDIDSPPLRFAIWRCQRINPGTRSHGIVLVDESFPLTETYNLILCYTVLEHVWFAYEAVKHLYEHLQVGAYLIETYSGKTGSEATGEDAQTAWDERDTSLRFLSERMVLLSGDFGSSVRIWRKKTNHCSSTVGRIVQHCLNRTRPTRVRLSAKARRPVRLMQRAVEGRLT